jgi:hypothetical protein
MRYVRQNYTMTLCICIKKNNLRPDDASLSAV